MNIKLIIRNQNRCFPFRLLSFKNL